MDTSNGANPPTNSKFENNQKFPIISISTEKILKNYKITTYYKKINNMCYIFSTVWLAYL